MNRKKIAGWALAGLLGATIVTIAAAPSAYAAAEETVCYTTETLQGYDVQEYQLITEAVPGTPEVPAVEAVPASAGEGWYTEGDDAAPTVTDEAVTFTKIDARAVGLRTAASGDLAGFTASWTGTAGDEFSHLRIVVDKAASAAETGNWRDDYQSLTVIDAGQAASGTSVVWVAGANVTSTIDEYAAANPGAVITSLGFHVDTNAPAGTEASVTSASFGPALIKAGTPAVPAVPAVDEIPAVFDWVTVGSEFYAEEPADEEGVRYVPNGLEREVEVETECPVVTPEPTTPAVVVPATVSPSETPAAVTATELAETGTDMAPLYLGAGVAALFTLAGLVLLVKHRPGRNTGA